MSSKLSQEQIDILLKGNANKQEQTPVLTDKELDTLGEVGNINMGTAATTLSTLLGQKVNITTPKVSVTKWEEIIKESNEQVVVVKVRYTDGLEGSNVLILHGDDAKIITNLMLGKQADVIEEEFSELHLSAVSEVMNQMIGSSATSMSLMMEKRINISPPKAYSLKLEEDSDDDNIPGFDEEDVYLVKVAFKMIIGKLINSEMMQIMPLKFAKKLVAELSCSGSADVKMENNTVEEQIVVNDASITEDKLEHVETSGQPDNISKKEYNGETISASNKDMTFGERNIEMIMDVPLDVTVELGRTNKLIKDVLQFGHGSIIELDKLSGEPVDVLVNGKVIARGEVVVIDESFGVRISDIVHPSERI